MAVEAGETAGGAYGSHRGVADDYLVLPSGGELTGQMKFITADAAMDDKPLRFTDLALFELSGRWSLLAKLEVFGQVDFLPSNRRTPTRKSWESAAVGLRSPLDNHVALAVSGGVGELMSFDGRWWSQTLKLEWKKQIDPDFLAFDLQAGLDSVELVAPETVSIAFMTEAAVQTSALFREPSGHWGAWVGIAYAVPIFKTGDDPTTKAVIDPQPRVDFHIGTVLSLVKEWDLFVDFAVIDRGDASNPATQLPILDGGFDQKQLVLGVTRHIAPHRTHNSDPLQIGAR